MPWGFNLWVCMIVYDTVHMLWYFIWLYQLLYGATEKLPSMKYKIKACFSNLGLKLTSQYADVILMLELMEKLDSLNWLEPWCVFMINMTSIHHHQLHLFLRLAAPTDSQPCRENPSYRLWMFIAPIRLPRHWSMKTVTERERRRPGTRPRDWLTVTIVLFLNVSPTPAEVCKERRWGLLFAML